MQKKKRIKKMAKKKKIRASEYQKNRRNRRSASPASASATATASQPPQRQIIEGVDLPPDVHAKLVERLKSNVVTAFTEVQESAADLGVQIDPDERAELALEMKTAIGTSDEEWREANLDMVVDALLMHRASVKAAEDAIPSTLSPEAAARLRALINS